MRLGYIRAGEQRAADQLGCQKVAVQPLREIAKAYVEAGQERFFELLEGQFSRIRIHLPLVKDFVQTFLEERVFQEDYALVRETMKSFFIDFAALKSVPIYKSVTLFDLIKFRRCCLFIQFALEEYCRKHNLVNSITHFRSLIIHFSEEDISTMIRSVCGIPYPSEFLEVVCSPEPDAGVFDLQYNPVLRVAGQYLIPVAVAGNSNIIRNSMLATRFRFDADDRVDPLGNHLVAMFAEAGVKAVSRTGYKWNGAAGEIDVMARLDNVLFVFECKNSLLPCNIFELRQSYGYVQKAFEQLSRLRHFFVEKEFREYLAAKSGIPLDGEIKLVTCVVTGNRMFDGYREQQHSVRCVFELANVITGGTGMLSMAKDYSKPEGPRTVLHFKSWKGNKLAASDLVDYLENDAWHRIFHEAMFQHDQIVKFGGKTLRLKSFMLDLSACFERLLNDPDVQRSDALSINAKPDMTAETE